jgi:hypothetical protein
VSYTKRHASELAVLRDDLTDALVLLRQLGPRGPEDSEFERVMRILDERIDLLNRQTPEPYGKWTGRPDCEVGSEPWRK